MPSAFDLLKLYAKPRSLARGVDMEEEAAPA